MRTLLAALVLAAMPAVAQDVPPGANGDFADTPCAYPEAALQAKAQGTTLVGFVGTASGSVKSVTVVSASGNADLDAATVACISRWRFDPDSALGKLQIGSHRINISWQIPASGPAQGRRVGIPHSCLYDYPPEAIAARAEGTTIVRFTITEKGRVEDVAVDTSAGNDILDEAAMACVRNWRYRPATEKGEPIAVPWKAMIKWKLPPPPEPPAPVN